MSAYADAIRRIDPTVNPVGVEASMRLQYGTLGHLGHDVFRREVEIAQACERERPGFLRGIARSFGLGEAYDRAERTVSAPTSTGSVREDGEQAARPLPRSSGPRRPVSAWPRSRR